MRNQDRITGLKVHFNAQDEAHEKLSKKAQIKKSKRGRKDLELNIAYAMDTMHPTNRMKHHHKKPDKKRIPKVTPENYEGHVEVKNHKRIIKLTLKG